MSDHSKDLYGGFEAAMQSRWPKGTASSARLQKRASSTPAGTANKSDVVGLEDDDGASLHEVIQMAENTSPQASSGPATTSVNLQAIHDYVDKEGLSETLYDLPEIDAYTFVNSREDKQSQAWAKVKEFREKPDEVEYIRISFRSGRAGVSRDIQSLPINQYPFDIAHEKKTENAKEGVTILVRYIFREAGYVDKAFSTHALKTFKIILKVIQKAVKSVGGDAQKLINSHSPSRLPDEIARDPPSKRRTKTTKNVGEPDQIIVAPTQAAAPGIEHAMRRMFVTPGPSKNANGKRVLDLNDDNATYNEIKKLEAKRSKYLDEQEQLRRSLEERKRQAEQDEARLQKLEQYEAEISAQEDQLLEGKSATWLMSQQRKFKKEDET